jgi:nuclear pore complex protein Nup107
MSSSMMEIDDGNDEAARAYSAITEQLESWTSPPLDTAAASSTASYTQDSVQWMKSFAASGEDSNRLTPQKRPSGEATPIMSNSAKKHSPSQYVLVPMETEDGNLPWIDRTLPTRSTTDSHEFRRYHDVLYTYLAARRSLSDRLRLNQEEAVLTVAKEDAPVVVDAKLEQEERSHELEYLSSLASLEDPLENNTWSLLVALRSLGIDALLWEPWGRATEISDFVNELASRKEATPGQLIHDLYYLSVSPLILQRRKQVLSWLERCHASTLGDVELPRKPKYMWPDSLEKLQYSGLSSNASKIQTLDPDAPILIDSTDPLYGKDGDNQEKLLKACLAYIKSGNLEQAMSLCQKYGQPWLAASIGGGQPFDIELVPDPETQQVVSIKVGNRRRALWKRTCWALSRSPKVSAEEAAIYALLSNDAQTALKNPALRSWEDGMYACWSAMLGRLEDDLLHRHHLPLKKILQEEQQLQATASIASWNEASILDQLASSPFEDMRPSDVLRGAMASFLVGKDAVLNFVRQEGSEEQTQDLILLRFLAHLLLYLDSLSAGTTPVDLPGISDVKNRFVLEYLQQLGLRPELWHMMALYASLLPKNIMMKEYPLILCNVQDDDDRGSMCKQMRDLLPDGVDLEVLRRVVRLLLSERDPHVPMRSISWLCHSESHLGDALVCTNMLLRKFFLAEDDQLPMALVFLDQYLPPQVTEFANVTDPLQDEDEAVDALVVSDSKLEFGGLNCYLDAYKAFRHWKEVMTSTPPTTVASKIVHNRAALNQTELEIANAAERRELVNQKRRASRKVVEAADAAQSKIMQVLTYGGGWLTQEDSIRQGDDDEEAIQRRQELNVIQSRYLPRAVFMFHSVCDKTAAWMADSLDDAISVLGKTALSTLDSASEDAASPLSPLYWICRATSLVETVACEENCIFDTFSEADGENFAELITESKVRELQYDTAFA